MRFFLILLAALFAGALPAQIVQFSQSVMDSLDEVRIQYIVEYKKLALREMSRSGIPASITLAQAILETSAGHSLLARQANNHFGLKCDAKWNGDIIYKHDDEFTTDSLPMLSCFRVYDDPAQSFESHSDFLLDPEKFNRYQALFKVPADDYASWARMLQYSGYSGASHYAIRLIEYIDRYQLYEIDRMVEQEPPADRILLINNIKCVVARKGENLRRLSEIFALPVEQLVVFNDKIFHPDSLLPAGSRVFLQRKADAWHGARTHHFLANEQTVMEVAQTYGIRYEALLRRNGLKPTQIPMPDAKLRLQGTREKKESVALRDPKIPIIEMIGEEVFIPPFEPRDLPEMSENNIRRLKEALSPLVLQNNMGFKTPEIQKDTVATLPFPPSTIFHKVSTGDTLYGLSKKYGVPAQQIKEINGLADNTLKIGQVLQISSK